MHSLAISFLNFFLLVGLLVYKLRQPLKNFVQMRHKSLREEIQAVREQLQLASGKFEEYSKKLSSIDSEIQSLRSQLKDDIAQMNQRVLVEAKKASEAVVHDARTSAQSLLSDLKADLYSDLVYRVVSRSELLIKERLTSDERVRIQQEFSKQVERIQ